MKKTLLLVALAIVSTFAFAQKPASGDLTAEVNLDIIWGILPVSFSLPKQKDSAFASIPAELRFRYFISDKGAVRLRIGLGSTSSKTAVYEATNTNKSEKTIKNGMSLLLSPGYEMHFEGTEKLSPYFGGEFGILMVGATTVDVTNASVENPGSGQVTVGDTWSSKSGSTTGIRLGIFMGADYYFTESIYVGGEFGLGLYSSISTGEGTWTSKAGSGTPATNKIAASSSSMMFGTSVSGIRLGIKF
ncbi:MAG: outer membrane beta-barrel protein [Bacteroidota bacterium]|nr:outer membrane beta-barrel protein [Bacteroidota bacterium]